MKYVRVSFSVLCVPACRLVGSANSWCAPCVQVRGVLGLEQLVLGSSDRFALGAAALGLRLCRPFLTGEPKHMRHLEPSYYTTSAYRCDHRRRCRAASSTQLPHTPPT